MPVVGLGMLSIASGQLAKEPAEQGKEMGSQSILGRSVWSWLTSPGEGLSLQPSNHPGWSSDRAVDRFPVLAVAL